MSDFLRYWHHGEQVWVRKDLKGKHSEHCLCYSCYFFHPNEPGNCHIAQATYEHNKKFDLVTPVWECPMFQECGDE